MYFTQRRKECISREGAQAQRMYFTQRCEGAQDVFHAKAQRREECISREGAKAQRREGAKHVFHAKVRRRAGCISRKGAKARRMYFTQRREGAHSVAKNATSTGVTFSFFGRGSTKYAGASTFPMDTFSFDL